MNFLAHIYLSGDNDLIKIGNFMADSIKGKIFEKYPREIQKGILTHRFIDSYTDAHPIFRKSTKRLHSKYHHYAGVIIDIYYDHFLAKNWSKYSQESLEDYTQRFYLSLETHSALLTERTKTMMPYMISQNWLLNYRSVEGIHTILGQMDSRTKNISKMRYASQELLAHYMDFEQEFSLFFEDLIQEVRQKLNAL